MQYSFYSIETGAIAGVNVNCSEDQLQDNTPPGHAPIAGTYDPTNRRVDLKTGEVVAYKPAAPAASAMRTWTWDDQAERWQPVPTLEALRQARIEPVQAAIEEREQQQARPVRELLEALLSNQPAPAASQQAFDAIRTAIAALQATRAAMAAATTQAELDAITWTP